MKSFNDLTITIPQLYYYHMEETDFYYFKQHDVIFVFRILGNLSVHFIVRRG